jgi:hypothetical protein
MEKLVAAGEFAAGTGTLVIRRGQNLILHGNNFRISRHVLKFECSRYVNRWRNNSAYGIGACMQGLHAVRGEGDDY